MLKMSPEEKDMIEKIIQKKMTQMFEEYDTDRNGVLEEEEIYNAVVDLNSHLELLGIKLNDEDIEKMIHKADINGDGKIQNEEFFNLM